MRSTHFVKQCSAFRMQDNKLVCIARTSAHSCRHTRTHTHIVHLGRIPPHAYVSSNDSFCVYLFSMRASPRTRIFQPSYMMHIIDTDTHTHCHSSKWWSIHIQFTRKTPVYDTRAPKRHSCTTIFLISPSHARAMRPCRSRCYSYFICEMASQASARSSADPHAYFSWRRPSTHFPPTPPPRARGRR